MFQQDIRLFVSKSKQDGVGEALMGIPSHLSHHFAPRHLLNAVVDKRTYDLGWETARALGSDNERPIMRDLLNNIQDGEVFYDIGAGVGDYCTKVLDLPSEHPIVAFEPGARVSELRERVPDDTEDFYLFEKAVSELDNDESKYSLLKNGMIVESSEFTDGEEIELPTIDSDEIIELGLPIPDVVKIDVNGFDLDALRAIEPLLRRSACRLLYIEIEPPDAYNTHRHPSLHELSRSERKSYFENQWSFDEILQIISESGFRIEYMYDLSGDLFIKAYK